MTQHPREDATDSLIAHVRGEAQSSEDLFRVLYDTLRKIAGNLMRHERKGHTLQPTALVHEAYLRLIEVERVTWKDKAHFCAMAAREMRRILIDHARRRRAAKRAGAALKASLSGLNPAGGVDLVDLIAVHEAMEELAQRYPRPSRIAELKLFGGLSRREMALVLEVSESTVAQDWAFSKAWLRRRLEQRAGTTE